MTDFNIYAGSGSWFTHSTSGNACNSIFCATSPTTCVGDCKMLFVSTLRTPQKIEINDIVYVGTDTGYEILPEGWYVSSTNGTVFNINSSGVLTNVNFCSGSTIVRDYDGNYYGNITDTILEEKINPFLTTSGSIEVGGFDADTTFRGNIYALTVIDNSVPETNATFLLPQSSQSIIQPIQITI